eukprot:Selendium_serpulae@DN6417_c1_g1_i3.p2
MVKRQYLSVLYSSLESGETELAVTGDAYDILINKELTDEEQCLSMNRYLLDGIATVANGGDVEPGVDRGVRNSGSSPLLRSFASLSHLYLTSVTSPSPLWLTSPSLLLHFISSL